MHKPVLLNEMLQALSPKDHGVYIDATYGGGGYTNAILESADCKVIAFDRDPEAEERAKSTKDHNAKSSKQLEFFKQPFSQMAECVREKVDGVVFDLGLSSYQLDNQDRGFSFRFNSPLDMRMSKDGPTASELINKLDEKTIESIIRLYGEEAKSRKIAKAIVQKRPIETTFELAEIVSHIVSPNGKIHPATKTFQAFRIYVNDELLEIKQGIEAALKILKPEGKLLFVTFNGLEDRVIKEFKMKCIQKTFPSRQEIRANPRSRSAKLLVYLNQGV